MSKEVATQNDNENPFAAAADDMGGADGAFMQFNGKSGEYIYGQDKDVLFDEDMMNDKELVEVAVDMHNACRGWICWIDGDVKDEKMVKVVDGKPPLEQDLPDYSEDYVEDGDGWKESIALPMRDIDTGDNYLFKGSSGGTLKTFKKLLKTYGKEFSRHDEDEEVAIVKLGMDSYMHTKAKYGKIYNPILELVRWMDVDELNEALASGDDGYEPEEEETKAVEEKPKAAKKKAAPKKKAHVDEPDEEEETPALEPEEDATAEEKPKKRRRRSF